MLLSSNVYFQYYLLPVIQAYLQMMNNKSRTVTYFTILFNLSFCPVIGLSHLLGIMLQ